MLSQAKNRPSVPFTYVYNNQALLDYNLFEDGNIEHILNVAYIEKNVMTPCNIAFSLAKLDSRRDHYKSFLEYENTGKVTNKEDALLIKSYINYLANPPIDFSTKLTEEEEKSMALFYNQPCEMLAQEAFKGVCHNIETAEFMLDLEDKAFNIYKNIKDREYSLGAIFFKKYFPNKTHEEVYKDFYNQLENKQINLENADRVTLEFDI